MEKFKGNSAASAKTQKLDAEELHNCGRYFRCNYLNRGFLSSLEMHFYPDLCHKGFETAQIFLFITQQPFSSRS